MENNNVAPARRRTSFAVDVVVVVVVVVVLVSFVVVVVVVVVVVFVFVIVFICRVWMGVQESKLSAITQKSVISQRPVKFQLISSFSNQTLSADG